MSMTDYRLLFENGLSEQELKELKKKLSDRAMGSSWTDYYWGAKCICKYDTDDFDPLLLSRAINDALKYGLSFRVNKELYLDAIKILASVYFQMAQYELVLNCLGSVLELDPMAPDWVFHDFITAQNRTGQIKRNLRRPGMFLEDLARNDDFSETTRKKQINILKEFFAGAALYVSKNPTAEVALDELREAAHLYGLTDSQEWKALEDACGGKSVKVAITAPESSERPSAYEEGSKKTISRKTTIPKEARPLVISLFPDEDAPTEDDGMQKKYEELLKKLDATQKELDKKTQELSSAGATLAELSSANENLRTIVAKYQADMSDYEAAIQAKEEEIHDIQERLRHVQKGTEEQKLLQAQIVEAQKQQKEMTSQFEALREALADSEGKLKATSEQLALRAKENKALRDELEKYRQESTKPITGDIAAEIKARYTKYIYITTDRLAKWLSKKLKVFRDWWESCVIGVLSNDQVLYATEHHYSSLEEFDLAALLRILKKNWYKLGTYGFMPHSSRECLDQMFDVRNRWAHFNTAPPSKEEIVGDLAIIEEFLSFLNCDTDTQKEVSKFAVEVGKMSL